MTHVSHTLTYWECNRGRLGVCTHPQCLLGKHLAESEFYVCCRFSSSAWHSVFTILSAVFVDFLAIGVAIATVGWCAHS